MQTKALFDPLIKVFYSRTVAIMVTIMGVIAGIGATREQIIATDFPVDMIIYRSGIEAFWSGGEMYSQPFAAGDIDLPFIYPPFGALFMLPIHLIPGITDDDAGNLVILISNALLLVVMWWVFRALIEQLDHRDNPARSAWALALASGAWGLLVYAEPIELNNGFAQINIILMCLVIADLVPRKRVIPQGWLIGIAAAIKLTPLAMLLYFALRRDVRAIITSAIAALLATAAAALIRFDATVEFYGQQLFGMGSGGDFGVNTAYQSNSSWRGMLQRWFISEEALEANTTLVTAVWALLTLATIAAGAWIMLVLLKRGYNIEAWGINALVMLLISPVSWSHHWVWLAVIIPVLLWRAVALALAESTARIAPVALSTVSGVWFTLIVLQEQPPKWWYGDSIAVHELNALEKFVVSDFVWLGLATLVIVGLSARHWPSQLRKLPS